MLLTSTLLTAIPRVRHGFTTRTSVALPPETTAHPAADFGPDSPPEALTQNRRHLLETLGMPEASLVQVSQVHGARVVDAKAVRPQTEADGLVESRAHIVLGIRTADCAPLLMAGTDANGHTHIAAVHAGWRGAVADIQSGAVRALGERGVSAGDLRVAIGPTIGFDAFEVGDEVVEAARHALDGDDPRLRKNERGRWHLDLPDLIERTLHRAGVSPEHVELVGGCTVQNEDLFFSYRRDRGKTGRHLAAIGLAPPYGSTEDTK